jgi:hypothetical protein
MKYNKKKPLLVAIELWPDLHYNFYAPDLAPAIVIEVTQ